jgi:single-strand DNA-binding protein
MINGATVTLAGYVATEPHYKTVNDETPHVSMRVAWTSRVRDRETGEWRDGKTSFANVNCWRKLANNVVSSLRKGQAIVVTGRLQVRDFDDREGRRRIAVDIEADAVGHDLSRGVAHFQRTFRGAGEAAADGQPDGLAAGEAIRAGLTDEDVPGQDVPGQDAPDLAPAAPEPRDGDSAAGTSDDMFNADAIGALAGTAQGAAAAAAPF